MGTDLQLVGVGGQGTILLVRVLLRAAEKAGLPAAASETLGMAQRGGSVSATVRLGLPGAGYGPLLLKGAADILVGLEPAEALRSLDYLSPDGTLLVGTEGLPPAAGNGPPVEYDADGLLARLLSRRPAAILLPAGEIARRAGAAKAGSAVFLGALASLPAWPLPAPLLLASLLELVPPRTREANEKAFELGLAHRSRAG